MTIPHSWHTIRGFRTLTRHKSRNKNISSPVITPPVITPPVITPPVITTPVITPPVITPPVITPPYAPAINTIVPTSNALQVNFSAPTDNGGAPITKYQYSLNNGNYVDANVTSSPITITGLTNRTSYSVRIRAVNSAGLGQASIAMASTPVSVPSAPTINSIVPSYTGTELRVNFSAPTDNGGSPIINYEYSLNNDPYVDTEVTSSPIYIIGLIIFTAYSVKIRAVNSDGPGQASNSVETMTVKSY